MARMAIHPGEHLAEELDALKMSAAELARRLRVPTNRVTEILHGQRAITGDTALRLLASLQEDGRLVDFLTEEIASYSDEQIGAATRGIHGACAKALRACVTLEPVLSGREDDAITVPAGFDPASIRLTGAVHGDPPFTGTLRHAGWRAAGVSIPARSGLDPKIIAPAEVEIA